MPISSAELTAEFTIETSAEGEKSPREQIETARGVAAALNLAARETGPESMGLSGSRERVLEALAGVIGASSLDAGAKAVRVQVGVTAGMRKAI